MNGWKSTRKCKRNASFAKLLSRVNAIKDQANHKRNMFKYGIQVPEWMDQASTTTLWEDVIKRELTEIDKYSIFKLQVRYLH